MRFAPTVFLASIFLVACAPKGQNDFNSDSMVDLDGSGGSVVIVPPPKRTKNTLIRITCESNATEKSAPFLLFDSQQRFAEIAFPTLPSENKGAESPLLAGSRNLFFSAGGQAFLADYDERGISHSLNLGKMATFKESRIVLSKLGMGKPRTYALSPDQNKFIVGVNGAYFLRSLENPEQDLAKWKIPGTLMNPRWENGINASSDFVFFDFVESGVLRQAFVRTSKGKLAEFEELSALGEGYHQLGLRRFDAENFIWLEWKKGKAVARIMNIYSRKIFNLKLPSDSDFTPGFAVLHEDKVGNLLALPSVSGVSFYRLRQGRVELSHKILFSEKMKDSLIAANSLPQLFAAADDTQIFLQLLQGNSNVMNIFTLEDGKSFRRLSESSCLNPSFFEETE